MTPQASTILANGLHHISKWMVTYAEYTDLEAGSYDAAVTSEGATCLTPRP